ncbi:Polycomb group RING finger protein 6, partial [Nibea albiflora]
MAMKELKHNAPFFLNLLPPSMIRAANKDGSAESDGDQLCCLLQDRFHYVPQQRLPSLSDTASSQPKLPLNQFYPYIRCALCCGFLIDATTITECLHTFCKSCIVKHFFHSNRCPTCSIVVHQTQPLYNIRPDRQLQDIVYKMVPFLEELERVQMTNFYKDRGLEVPKPAGVSPQGPVVLRRQKKDIPQSVFTIPPELDVSLVLEFVGAEEGINNYKPLERRYVRVSGEATVRHVELFIRRKMELSP